MNKVKYAIIVLGYRKIGANNGIEVYVKSVGVTALYLYLSTDKIKVSYVFNIIQKTNVYSSKEVDITSIEEQGFKGLAWEEHQVIRDLAFSSSNIEELIPTLSDEELFNNLD